MYKRRAWEHLWTISDTRVVRDLQHELDGQTREVLVQDLRGLSFADVLASVMARCATGEWQEPKPAHVTDPSAPCTHSELSDHLNSSGSGGGSGLRSGARISNDSSLAAISQEEFVAHVREALRTVDELLILARNPLVHSRVVRARVTSDAPPQERARALQVLLIEEAEVFRGTRRGDTWFRALEAAYLNSLGKHESAAKGLGMSYSTFRGRLIEATNYRVAALWERELSCASEV